MMVRKTADEIVFRWLDEKGHIFASEEATREGPAPATLLMGDTRVEDE